MYCGMSNPAAAIIERLGGFDAVAGELKVSTVTVRRWTYAKAKGGTGGFIPHWYHQALLAFAKSSSVPLSHADFVTPPVGREVA